MIPTRPETHGATPGATAIESRSGPLVSPDFVDGFERFLNWPEMPTPADTSPGRSTCAGWSNGAPPAHADEATEMTIERATWARIPSRVSGESARLLPETGREVVGRGLLLKVAVVRVELDGAREE